MQELNLSCWNISIEFNFIVWPFKYQVFAVARALFSSTAHHRTLFFLWDKKDVHLKGHCPIRPLNVNIYKYMCIDVCGDITTPRSEQKNWLPINQIIGARIVQSVWRLGYGPYNPGFASWQEQNVFLFSGLSREALITL